MKKQQASHPITADSKRDDISELENRLNQLEVDWTALKQLPEEVLDKNLTYSEIAADKQLPLNAQTVHQVDAFQQLSIEQCQKLVPLCRYRYYKAGEAIVSFRTRDTDIYFIVSGQVQATILLPSDQQPRVAFGERGYREMFGELSAIDGELRSAHVVAMTDALIFSMSAEDFANVRYTYPSVADATLKQMAKTIRRHAEVTFRAMSIRKRINHVVLSLAVPFITDENKAVIADQGIIQQIANYVGATHAEVVQEISHLLGEGLIEHWDEDSIATDFNKLRQALYREAA